MNETQRTMEWLRNQGYLVCKTEYWQQSNAERGIVQAAKAGNWQATRKAVDNAKKYGPGIRRDLFGFIDIVALGQGDIIAVQCTSTGNLGARSTKIKVERRTEAIEWLSSGGRIWLVGWKKYAKPVERKWWRHTLRELRLVDFALPEPTF